MTRRGGYRWRTRLRRRLPWFLVDRGIAAKGAGDCGAHEWYNHDGAIARCYHCEVGERPWPVATQDDADPGRRRSSADG